MIKLKVQFSNKHINIYVLKNKTNILFISTKNYNLKQSLFRTNNLSAILIISDILAKELKRSGLNDQVLFECTQFNGNIIKFQKDRKPVILKEKANTDYVMVDGLGIGDVSEIVLRDRRMMADDGMIVVIATIDAKTGAIIGNPDLISRGFL